VRCANSILVTYALLLGFIEAPFAHVHEQAGGDDHHAAEQAHAHLSQAARRAAGPAFDQSDPADDERLVNWFQTVQQSSFLLYFAPEPSGVVEPRANGEFVRAAPSICGHDPPLTGTLSSRAPPIIPA
jgi:hypothetical protein